MGRDGWGKGWRVPELVKRRGGEWGWAGMGEGRVDITTITEYLPEQQNVSIAKISIQSTLCSTGAFHPCWSKCNHSLYQIQVAKKFQLQCAKSTRAQQDNLPPRMSKHILFWQPIVSLHLPSVSESFNGVNLEKTISYYSGVIPSTKEWKLNYICLDITHVPLAK